MRIIKINAILSPAGSWVQVVSSCWRSNCSEGEVLSDPWNLCHWLYSCACSQSEQMLMSIFVMNLNRVCSYLRYYALTRNCSRGVQTWEVSVEVESWSTHRSRTHWVSECLSPDRWENVNLNEVIASSSDCSGWDTTSVDGKEIVGKALSSDDVDNNAASLFNSNSTIAIAIVILPVDFSFDSGDEIFKSFDHVKKIFVVIIDKFFLFSLDSPLEIQDLGVDSFILGFSNCDVSSKSFDLDLQFSAFPSDSISFIS